MLLYALDEGREVKADAGKDNRPFPEEPTPDSVLTWCAGLRVSKPPAVQGASVEIRSSTKRHDGVRDGVRSSEPSDVSEAIVLVSCHEFSGAGPWMSPKEEQEFIEGAEARGRKVTRLGAEVLEPWRI